MQDIYLGRQPIYDRQLRVIAYELLFRSSGTATTAQVLDGDYASGQVLLNALTELGLDRVVGPHRAFVNLTRSLLLGNPPLHALQGRLVLEVLEDVEVDDQLIAALRRLRAEGHIIALDDFVYDDSKRTLVELAHIVKLDVRALGREETARHVAALRAFKLKLLAEKVETQEELDHCRELGFDYFQGYFFCRPNIVQGRRMPTNRVAALQLVQALHEPAITVNEIERLITNDVALSYRLLRYINSASFALKKEVDSIQRAIVLLGTDAIRNLALLVVLSNFDDKPQELTTVALTRAKMCEQLGETIDVEDRNVLFSLGLLSVLDAFMDSPMEQLVEELPLAAEVRDALLAGQGPMGRLLRCVLAYEQGNWGNASCPRLDPNNMREAYLSSISWADATRSALCA